MAEDVSTFKRVVRREEDIHAWEYAVVHGYITSVTMKLENDNLILEAILAPKAQRDAWSETTWAEIEGLMRKDE